MQPDKVLLRLVDDLVTNLTHFTDRLAEMHKLIEDEHAAVAQAQLSVIEGITQQKVLVGEAIESLVRALKIASSKLAEAMDCEFESYSGSLSEIASLIEGLSKERPDLAFKAQSSRVLDLIEECHSIHSELNPAVQVNKKMLERMLQFQRENQRFWQEVATESEATYGADGSRRHETAARSAIKVSI